METLENQYQRRAIAGDRHFILADGSIRMCGRCRGQW